MRMSRSAKGDDPAVLRRWLLRRNSPELELECLYAALRHMPPMFGTVAQVERFMNEMRCGGPIVEGRIVPDEWGGDLPLQRRLA